VGFTLTLIPKWGCDVDLVGIINFHELNRRKAKKKRIEVHLALSIVHRHSNYLFD
jgi:hypothetical protein